MKKLLALTNIAIISSLLLAGCSTSANKQDGQTELSESQAKSTVLGLAHLSEKDVSSMKVEKDEEDGVEIYRVTFTSNDKEYEYEINRMTGELLDNHQDDDDSTTDATVKVSKDEANKIALDAAHLTNSEIKNAKVELDDDKDYYEVEFESDGKEYSYKVSTKDGTILEKDIDDDVDDKDDIDDIDDDRNDINDIDDDDDDINDINDDDDDRVTTPTTTLISRDKAKAIALNNAGVSATNVRNLKIELDSDDGKRYYEVDFDAGNSEYSYKIDASKGTILDRDIEVDDDDDDDKPVVSKPKPTKPATTLISRDKAKSIALNNASVSTSNARNLKIELDSDDGKKYYEVDFEVGNKEYSYKIDASKGTILDRDIEVNDDDDDDDKPVVSKPKPTKPATTLISRDKAKSIALNNAGVSAGNIRNLKIELDNDDGKKYYEVDFESANKEYAYKIDASKGSILDRDIEVNDDDDDDDKPVVSKPKPTKPATTIISKDNAKNIAFNHASVSASKVRELKIELDDDDGKKYYEIDFKSGNKEYTYEIDARTGTILSHDVEEDD